MIGGSDIADGTHLDVAGFGTNLHVVGVGINLDVEGGVDASPNHAYPRGHCMLGGAGASLSKDQFALIDKHCGIDFNSNRSISSTAKASRRS